MTGRRSGGRHGAAPDPLPGDRLVRVGAGVFGLGLVAVVVVVVQFVVTQDQPGTLVTALAGLLPLGFLIALVGLLRQARAGRRPPG